MITYAVKNISVLDDKKNVICSVHDETHKYVCSYSLNENDNIIAPLKVSIREHDNNRKVLRMCVFNEEHNTDEIIKIINKINTMWDLSSVEIKRLYM